MALSGGEDYELLFTARPGDTGRIASLSNKLKLAITPIGKIAKKADGVTAIGPDGAPLKLGKTGFEHF